MYHIAYAALESVVISLPPVNVSFFFLLLTIWSLYYYMYLVLLFHVK